MARFDVAWSQRVETTDGVNFTVVQFSTSGVSGSYLTDGDPDSTTFEVGETLSYGATGGGFTFVAGDGVAIIFQNNATGAYYRMVAQQEELRADNSSFTASQADYVVCFLAGTGIATPHGDWPVEALSIGDEVLTADGQVRPVRWIGRQTVARFFADPLRALPVTIRAGALGEGLPLRDLHVSPDHAMLVEGVLVHAGAMVNGRSILRMADVADSFTYYHVELADHALILAEGAPAETFVDNVTRRRFDNTAEYEALYGARVDAQVGTQVDTGELDLPRVKSARQMPAALARHLEWRAQAIGVGLARAA